MSISATNLHQIDPVRIFASELRAVWDRNPVPVEQLASLLGVQPALIDMYFEGRTLPTRDDLFLVLRAMAEDITDPEMAAWMTALDFVRALTRSAVLPPEQVLRELVLSVAFLRDNSPSAVFESFIFQPGLPDPADLLGLLNRVYEHSHQTRPWLLVLQFARLLLDAHAQREASDRQAGLQREPGSRRLPTQATGGVPPRSYLERHVGTILAEASRRDDLWEGVPDAFPTTIYLSNEAAGPGVEQALTHWLAVQGEEIVYRGEPIIGSLWQTFVSLLKRKAEDNLEDGMTLAGRAVGLYGLDTRQAEVNQAEAEAFAKVMEALANVESAIIHHGTLLVVKHSGSVVRRELSQLEVEVLRRNPALTAQPHQILDELQRLVDEEVLGYQHGRLEGHAP